MHREASTCALTNSKSFTEIADLVKELDNNLAMDDQGCDDLISVTDEEEKEESKQLPGIPDVCHRYGRRLPKQYLLSTDPP